MQIKFGVHVISGKVGNRPLYLYLLCGKDRVVLLDSGHAPHPERLILPFLAGIGLSFADIDFVINTHSDSDHCGGNHTLKAANPNVLLTCGTADKELIENPQTMWDRRYNAYSEVHGISYDAGTRSEMMGMLGKAQTIDFTWSGGEILRLGPDWCVEIHHTPGHTPGHLSIFDPQSHTMYCGDAVHGAVYPDFKGAPALCPTYVHVESYLRTITYFESLPIKRLASCHWPLKTGPEVKEFLLESRRFVALAEETVLTEIGKKGAGLTLRDLIFSVGPVLGAWPRDLDRELVFLLAGHLDQLVASGRLIVTRGSEPPRYFVAQAR